MISLGFLFILFASLCASISSLMIRKTLDYKGTEGGYLSVYFFISFFFSSLLNSIFTFNEPWSLTMTALGGATGFLVIGLMLSLSLALKNGPTGLSFAFQNAGSVFPPLLMALIFKSSFGFELTIGNILGMLLVVLGLFWAARTKKGEGVSKKWLLFALLAFAGQALVLSIYQWRCLLTSKGLPSHLLIPFHCEQREEVWFMPAMFFTAWLFQIGLFLLKEKRTLRKAELIGGCFGGIANASATFLLLSATRVATTTEKAMLFPLFAVLVIFLCNLYGKTLYKEKVNWSANACCAAGVLVGTLF